MQKSTQPLLSGKATEERKQKQHLMPPVYRPTSTSTVQSSQPPPSTQTSATPGSELSKQVDEALEQQRAITGKLDEQIANVRTKISQHQLQQQQQQQGTVTTRPSLRWNLVPDEHIISPRRSRHSRLTVRGSRSPSRQTLPLLDPAAYSGPVPAFNGPTTGVTIASSNDRYPSLTSGQMLPPVTDTQNYLNYIVPGTTVNPTGF